MEYDEAVNGQYSDALSMGVRGHSAEANAQRAQRAAEFDAEHAQRVEKAYEGRAPWDDIDVPAVFGSKLVVKHGGDLDAVLNDPQFESLIQKSAGFPDGLEAAPDVQRYMVSGHLKESLRDALVEDGAAAGARSQVDHNRMTYDELLQASPVDALTLGVEGHTAEANAQRAELAHAYVAEYETQFMYADEYSHPDGPPAKPFATHLVAEAGGDLSRVIDTDALERAVAVKNGLLLTEADTWEGLEPYDPAPAALREGVRSESVGIGSELIARGAVAPPMALEEVEKRIGELEYQGYMLDSLAPTMEEPEFYERQSAQLLADAKSLEDRYGPQLDAAREERASRLNSSTAESAQPAARSSHDVASDVPGQGSTESRSAALAAAGQSERSPAARAAGTGNRAQTPSKVQQVMARIKTGLGLERG